LEKHIIEPYYKANPDEKKPQSYGLELDETDTDKDGQIFRDE